MASLFPIFLKLHRKPVLIVGGGSVAAQKLDVLAKCDARVVVVAPWVCVELEERAAGHEVTIHRRRYRHSDLQGMALVFAATNDSDLNHSIVTAAERMGIFANAVDDPAYCHFYTPAIVHRGAISIAMSTEGRFPGLAKALRACLDEWLPAEDDDLMEALYRLRSQLRQSHPTRKQALQKLIGAIESDYLNQPDGNRNESRRSDLNPVSMPLSAASGTIKR